MKQGIIFDMDGTLWDSAENVARSWTEALQKFYSIEKEITEKMIQGVMGKTMDVIAEILFEEYDNKYDMIHVCGEYENEYLRVHGGKLYEGVEETLKKLKENYTLCIVSNCQSGYIEAFLEYYGLADYFEDIECFGNNNKQKGENIRDVVERNGLTKAVYVGDIQGDYDATMRAGIDFVHAAYGFGTIKEPVEKITRFSELPEVVAGVLQ